MINNDIQNNDNKIKIDLDILNKLLSNILGLESENIVTQQKSEYQIVNEIKTMIEKDVK